AEQRLRRPLERVEVHHVRRPAHRALRPPRRSARAEQSGGVRSVAGRDAGAASGSPPGRGLEARRNDRAAHRTDRRQHARAAPLARLRAAVSARFRISGATPVRAARPPLAGLKACATSRPPSVDLETNVHRRRAAVQGCMRGVRAAIARPTANTAAPITAGPTCVTLRYPIAGWTPTAVLKPARPAIASACQRAR